MTLIFTIIQLKCLGGGSTQQKKNTLFNKIMRVLCSNENPRPNCDRFAYLQLNKMIFHQLINHHKQHVKPAIKFNYISPSTIQPASTISFQRPSIINRPLSFTNNQHLFSNSSKKAEDSRNGQRKKIFDRTYSTKSSFVVKNSKQKSLENSTQKIRNKIKNYGQEFKKSRKHIFPKLNKKYDDSEFSLRDGNKHFASSPFFYPQDQIQGVQQLKPPSSLTSYVRLDPLRKEHKYTTYSNPFKKQPEDLYYNLREEYDNIQDQKTPSQVKVDLSHSQESDKSIVCLNSNQNSTQERFFDRDLASVSPNKMQKLAQVDLYSTTVNSNFRKLRVPSQLTLLQKIKQYLKSHQMEGSLLPLFLIVMGLFLLLVQASN